MAIENIARLPRLEALFYSRAKMTIRGGWPTEPQRAARVILNGDRRACSVDLFNTLGWLPF